MVAKQKRSLFIRFGDMALGKKQFRFESHLLPSQCAERIEKLAYRTFHHGYFAGQCRIVSLDRLDENTYDFVVKTRTNDPLGYTLVSAKGHLDVDSISSYTTVQGTVQVGWTMIGVVGVTVIAAFLCLWISASYAILIVGVLPCAGNTIAMWRKTHQERTLLFEEVQKAITLRQRDS